MKFLVFSLILGLSQISSASAIGDAIQATEQAIKAVEKTVVAHVEENEAPKQFYEKKEILNMTEAPASEMKIALKSENE